MDNRRGGIIQSKKEEERKGRHTIGGTEGMEAEGNGDGTRCENGGTHGGFQDDGKNSEEILVARR